MMAAVRKGPHYPVPLPPVPAPGRTGVLAALGLALLLAGCGAVGAIAITWWISSGAQSEGIEGAGPGEHTTDVLLTCVAAGVLAALLGGATWRLGRALRASNTAPAPAAEVVAA